MGNLPYKMAPGWKVWGQPLGIGGSLYPREKKGFNRRGFKNFGPHHNHESQ